MNYRVLTQSMQLVVVDSILPEDDGRIVGFIGGSGGTKVTLGNYMTHEKAVSVIYDMTDHFGMTERSPFRMPL